MKERDERRKNELQAMLAITDQLLELSRLHALEMINYLLELSRREIADRNVSQPPQEDRDH